jgi:L-iditol 2-dehydrogenase
MNMKAATLTAIGKFEVREVAVPKIRGESEVRVRIKAVGVCGSDLHYYTTGRIGSQVVRFPFVVGHESSGIVEQVGRRVKNVKVGQRVAIDPAVSCGRCDQCQAGREHTCRHLRFMGAPGQMEGAMQEYVVIDGRNCFPMKASMTFDQGALSEPLAIAVYSVDRSDASKNTNVAILGVGPIGMSIFHVLRAKGIGHVYVTDKINERLAYSRRLRPRWSGNPDEVDVVKEINRRESLQPDIVYECSGSPEAIVQGIQLLKPGGRLVIVGIPEVDDIAFPIHELRRKEITILNIRRQVHCTKKAIALIAGRKVAMDSLVTHHFALEETQRAFDLVSSYRDGVMKAIINLD